MNLLVITLVGICGLVLMASAMLMQSPSRNLDIDQH